MNEADAQMCSLVKDRGTIANRVVSVGTIAVLLPAVDWAIF